jgi:hypothetical protein
MKSLRPLQIKATLYIFDVDQQYLQTFILLFTLNFALLFERIENEHTCTRMG